MFFLPFVLGALFAVLIQHLLSKAPDSAHTGTQQASPDKQDNAGAGDQPEASTTHSTTTDVPLSLPPPWEQTQQQQQSNDSSKVSAFHVHSLDEAEEVTAEAQQDEDTLPSKPPLGPLRHSLSSSSAQDKQTNVQQAGSASRVDAAAPKSPLCVLKPRRSLRSRVSWEARPSRLSQSQQQYPLKPQEQQQEPCSEKRNGPKIDVAAAAAAAIAAVDAGIQGVTAADEDNRPRQPLAAESLNQRLGWRSSDSSTASGFWGPESSSSLHSSMRSNSWAGPQRESPTEFLLQERDSNQRGNRRHIRWGEPAVLDSPLRLVKRDRASAPGDSLMGRDEGDGPMKRVQLASENQHAATVASNAQLLHRVGRHSAGRHRYSQLAAHSSVDLPPALSGIIEHGDQAPLYKRRKMSGPATLRVSFRSNGEPSQESAAAEQNPHTRAQVLAQRVAHYEQPSRVIPTVTSTPRGRVLQQRQMHPSTSFSSEAQEDQRLDWQTGLLGSLRIRRSSTGSSFFGSEAHAGLLDEESSHASWTGYRGLRPFSNSQRFYHNPASIITMGSLYDNDSFLDEDQTDGKRSSGSQSLATSIANSPATWRRFPSSRGRTSSPLTPTASSAHHARGLSSWLDTQLPHQYVHGLSLAESQLSQHSRRHSRSSQSSMPVGHHRSPSNAAAPFFRSSSARGTVTVPPVWEHPAEDSSPSALPKRFLHPLSKSSGQLLSSPIATPTHNSSSSNNAEGSSQHSLPNGSSASIAAESNIHAVREYLRSLARTPIVGVQGSEMQEQERERGDMLLHLGWWDGYGSLLGSLPSTPKHGTGPDGWGSPSTDNGSPTVQLGTAAGSNWQQQQWRGPLGPGTPRGHRRSSVLGEGAVPLETVDEQPQSDGREKSPQISSSQHSLAGQSNGHVQAQEPERAARDSTMGLVSLAASVLAANAQPSSRNDSHPLSRSISLGATQKQTQDGQQDHQLTTTDSEGRARTSVCGAASLRDESSSPSSGTAVSPSAASFSSVNGTALPLKSKGRISANFSQNPLHPAELKGTATVAASRRVAFACEDEDEDEAPHREDRRSTLGDVGMRGTSFTFDGQSRIPVEALAVGKGAEQPNTHPNFPPSRFASLSAPFSHSTPSSLQELQQQQQQQQQDSKHPILPSSFSPPQSDERGAQHFPDVSSPKGPRRKRRVAAQKSFCLVRSAAAHPMTDFFGMPHSPPMSPSAHMPHRKMRSLQSQELSPAVDAQSSATSDASTTPAATLEKGYRRKNSTGTGFTVFGTGAALNSSSTSTAPNSHHRSNSDVQVDLCGPDSEVILDANSLEDSESEGESHDSGSSSEEEAAPPPSTLSIIAAAFGWSAGQIQGDLFADPHSPRTSSGDPSSSAQKAVLHSRRAQYHNHHHAGRPSLASSKHKPLVSRLSEGSQARTHAQPPVTAAANSLGKHQFSVHGHRTKHNIRRHSSYTHAASFANSSAPSSAPSPPATIAAYSNLNVVVPVSSADIPNSLCSSSHMSYPNTNSPNTSVVVGPPSNQRSTRPKNPSQLSNVVMSSDDERSSSQGAITHLLGSAQSSMDHNKVSRGFSVSSELEQKKNTIIGPSVLKKRTSKKPPPLQKEADPALRFPTFEDSINSPGWSPATQGPSNPSDPVSGNSTAEASAGAPSGTSASTQRPSIVPKPASMHYSDDPRHKGRMRALLITKDAVKVQAIHTALPAVRYEHRTASSFDQYLAYINSRTKYLPDVVLLDGQLEDFSVSSKPKQKEDAQGRPVSQHSSGAKSRRSSATRSHAGMEDDSNQPGGMSAREVLTQIRRLHDPSVLPVILLATPHRTQQSTTTAATAIVDVAPGKVAKSEVTPVAELGRKEAVAAANTATAMAAAAAAEGKQAATEGTQRPLDASLLAEMQSGVPTPVQHNPAMAAFTNANVDHIFGPDSGTTSSLAGCSTNSENVQALQERRSALLQERRSAVLQERRSAALQNPVAVSSVLLSNKVVEELPAAEQQPGAHLLASASAAQDGVNALRQGANDYVVLPVLPTELEARINMQVALRRAVRIKAEASSSMHLLRSMLPGHVIRKLKAGQTYIAQYHEQVSVAFVDIVGFTVASSNWPSSKVAQMLNDLFASFDVICDQHGVYNMDTIGDGYLMLAGHDGETDHALRMLRTARDMIALVQNPLPQGERVNIRVGLNTGPAHSGVLGTKRLKYTVWGDSVNCASRMESSGFAGTIQVSSDTYHAAMEQMALTQDELPLVSSLNFSKQSMRPSEFSFVPLGERTIKGKGLLSTYLVTEGDWETALAGYRAQQQQAWQPTPEGIKAHQIGYEEGMRAGIASTAVIARSNTAQSGDSTANPVGKAASEIQTAAMADELSSIEGSSPTQQLQQMNRARTGPMQEARHCLETLSMEARERPHTSPQFCFDDQHFHIESEESSATRPGPSSVGTLSKGKGGGMQTLRALSHVLSNPSQWGQSLSKGSHNVNRVSSSFTTGLRSRSGSGSGRYRSSTHSMELSQVSNHAAARSGPSQSASETGSFSPELDSKGSKKKSSLLAFLTGSFPPELDSKGSKEKSSLLGFLKKKASK